MIHIFVKDMKFPLLLDAYGALLTERKRELLDYYYNEDYSLAEIAELTGISRQGVRDSIKKGEEELYGFEEKLGVVSRGTEMTDALNGIAADLAELRRMTAGRGEDDLTRKLDGISDTIARLRDAAPANSTAPANFTDSANPAELTKE